MPATEVQSLPTLEEYEQAIRAFSTAYDEVERLQTRLAQISDAYLGSGATPNRTPTFADVGMLWSFVDDVGTEVKAIAELRNSLNDSLLNIESMRRDDPAELAAWRERRGTGGDDA